MAGKQLRSLNKMFHYHFLSYNSIELFKPEKDIFYYRLLAEHIETFFDQQIFELCPYPTSIWIAFDHKTILPEQIVACAVDFDSKYVAKKEKPFNTFTIPVCFDEEYAIDKMVLEKNLNLSFEEIVKLYIENTYRIEMYGFIPGFAYLSGLHEKLQLPRKSTPARHVPKGSVAIAHTYTGIYPADSPGGWYVIGYSPQQFFDIVKESFLAQPGDYLVIKSISKSQLKNYG